MAYEAEIAGLQWSIEPVPHSIAPGLAVRVSGYSDTMRTLLREVLGAINKLEIKKDRFDITKERYVRSLRNWKTKQPYQWSSRLREEAMHVGTLVPPCIVLSCMRNAFVAYHEFVVLCRSVPH